MKCLFCEIASKKKEVNIIEENEWALTILDISPVSDGHLLLITKRHFADIGEVDEESWNHLHSLLKNIINKLKKNFQPQGFNFITNMGEIAYQSIFHFHLHIIPKYAKEKGFIWKVNPELKYSLDQVIKKLK